MPGIGESRDARIGPDAGVVEALLARVIFNGELPVLIAMACEEAMKPGTASDPARQSHPRVMAAVRAYANWTEAKEQPMATDVGREIESPGGMGAEPEVLPLSLAGNWVAWSSDGMRIVAAAPTIEEAERLAFEAGEPEPILERHPGRHPL